MVDDLGPDELAVGYDNRNLVAGDNPRRAQSDVIDDAEGLAYLDEVTGPNRLLEEDDDPRNEVLRDVLEAKADAHEQDGRGGKDR